MDSLAPYPQDDELDTGLVPAECLPRGALVLGLSGTDRTELKWSLALWGAGLFVLGVVIGRWSKKNAQSRR